MGAPYPPYVPSTSQSRKAQANRDRVWNQPREWPCAWVYPDGRKCMAFPKRYATLCLRHGGRVPGNIQAARERRWEALTAKELVRLGLSPVDVNPINYYLDLINEAANNIEVYRRKIEELGDNLTAALTHPNGNPTGMAVLNVYVVAYNEERDRQASLIQHALKIGLDERRVKLAENTAERLTKLLEAAIGEARLDPDAAVKLRKAMARRLRAA